MLDGFSEHDARALIHGETGNAGADGGKSDGFKFAVGSKPQGMGRGSGERFGSGGGAAEAHAGGVNDEASLELATGGEGRVADGNAAEVVALALDFVAALAANGAGYAAAENEIVVGGVDDGVDVHFSKVALLDDDAFGERSHWKDIVEQIAEIRDQGSGNGARCQEPRSEAFGWKSGG